MDRLTIADHRRTSTHALQAEYPEGFYRNSFPKAVRKKRAWPGICLVPLAVPDQLGIEPIKDKTMLAIGPDGLLRSFIQFHYFSC